MRNSLKEILLNLVFPPQCAFCSAHMSPLAHIWVCDDCANSLPYCKPYNRCRHCGKPISGKGICNSCRVRRTYTTRITSPFIYKDSVTDAIVRFKKEQNAYLARTLSLYISEMVKYDFGGVSFDCAVSVPPRKKPYTEEHFDQAAYLARRTAYRLGLKYIPRVLRQTGKIQKQSSLGHDKRFENVKDKFEVISPAKIKNKTVLLVDDVCTTGATLEECAKVLKEAGAYRVYAASAATVVL